MKREYDGDPLDLSWQNIEDRPFGNDGETVDVIENTANDTRESVSLSASESLTEHEADLVAAIIEHGPVSRKELTNEYGFSRRIRTKLPDLNDLGLVEKVDNKDGRSYIWDSPLDSMSDIKFEDGTHEFISTTIRYYCLSQNKREILSFAAQYPDKTHSEIAENVDVSRSLVGLTFDEYYDPRTTTEPWDIIESKTNLREINRLIEATEQRLQKLKRRKSELKR